MPISFQIIASIFLNNWLSKRAGKWSLLGDFSSFINVQTYEIFNFVILNSPVCQNVIRLAIAIACNLFKGFITSWSLSCRVSEDSPYIYNVK